MPLTINFSPFPILETTRLTLRQFDRNDADALFKMRSNPETMRFVPRPIMQSIDEAREHIDMIEDKIRNNEGINWAISLRNVHDCIGIIGHYKLMPEHFRSEIGYLMLPEFRGKGIMSEAIAAVVDYGFNQLKLHSVEAIIDPENHASATVLERNNFIREAHLKENQFYEGKFIDTVIYSRLNPVSVKS